MLVYRVAVRCKYLHFWKVETERFINYEEKVEIEIEELKNE